MTGSVNKNRRENHMTCTCDLQTLNNIIQSSTLSQLSDLLCWEWFNCEDGDGPLTTIWQCWTDHILQRTLLNRKKKSGVSWSCHNHAGKLKLLHTRAWYIVLCMAKCGSKTTFNNIYLRVRELRCKRQCLLLRKRIVNIAQTTEDTIWQLLDMPIFGHTSREVNRRTLSYTVTNEDKDRLQWARSGPGVSLVNTENRVERNCGGENTGANPI